MNNERLRQLCHEVVAARTAGQEQEALRELSKLINTDLDKTLWPDDGVSLIAAERQRQMDVEGWSAEHDDQYAFGQIPLAVTSYSTFAAMGPDVRDQLRETMAATGTAPGTWPTDWNPAFWKPGKGNSNADRMREMVKAGALCAAEIDRLLRAQAQEKADVH